jgi:hypothetical protein
MDNETIAFEVGQTWRTKMDSEFMGARVYVVKVLDNTKVVVAVDNMLLDCDKQYIIDRSILSYCHSR